MTKSLDSEKLCCLPNWAGVVGGVGMEMVELVSAYFDSGRHEPGIVPEYEVNSPCEAKDVRVHSEASERCVRVRDDR